MHNIRYTFSLRAESVLCNLNGAHGLNYVVVRYIIYNNCDSVLLRRAVWRKTARVSEIINACLQVARDQRCA